MRNFKLYLVAICVFLFLWICQTSAVARTIRPVEYEYFGLVSDFYEGCSAVRRILVQDSDTSFIYDMYHDAYNELGYEKANTIFWKLIDELDGDTESYVYFIDTISPTQEEYEIDHQLKQVTFNSYLWFLLGWRLDNYEYFQGLKLFMNSWGETLGLDSYTSWWFGNYIHLYVHSDALLGVKAKEAYIEIFYGDLSN